MAAPGTVIWGVYETGHGAPVEGLGRKFPQKLKQSADIVYSLQKRSKFRNFGTVQSLILYLQCI